MRRPYNGDYNQTQGFNDPCCRASYAKFGMKGHNGWDIGTPSGTPIVAPHAGKVIEAAFDAGGYGNYVKIENGTEGSVLAHLSSIAVKPGQTVAEGDPVGKSGNTGNSSGPHLHWGYYRMPRDRKNGFDGFIDQGPHLAPPPAPFPRPNADNEGVINVEGSTLRGRTAPTTNASSPWYFDHKERVTLIAKTKGDTVTVGPYAPSNWWYLAQGRDNATAPQVFISDAYVRTTKNPAAVPDYVAPSPIPTPVPTPKPTPPPPAYTFTKDLDCVTEVIPAGLGNFEVGNFPALPKKAVIHDYGTKGHDTVGSTINEFKRNGSQKSAHFVVSGKRIIQMVSLKDRGYHAGSHGNDFIGIETDPAQDPDTIESTKRVLREFETKKGYQLELIEHNTIMNTSCGDDVDLANYDITEQSTPPNADIDDLKNRVRLLEAFKDAIKALLAKIGINL